ncbi:MAG: hypothetical protein Q4C47_04880, partial [Planctomycetia bacterium]|nr:hypothetical protein [Planctomycetia bacterium]
DASKPVTEEMDALLAIQPSTLSPEAWENFMNYVKSGKSVIIFEDPFPVFAPSIPGTSQPKTQQMNSMYAMMMPPQPVPKGNDRELWDLLGVNFSRDRIVFQNYNPEVRFRQFPKEFVWVDSSLRHDDRPVFAQNEASVSGLQKVLFPHPGYLTSLNRSTGTSELTFTPLVRTGTDSGFTPYREILRTSEFGEKSLNQDPRRTLTHESYVIAAKIEGTVELPPEAPTTATGPSVVDPAMANFGAGGGFPGMPMDEPEPATGAEGPQGDDGPAGTEVTSTPETGAEQSTETLNTPEATTPETVVTEPAEARPSTPEMPPQPREAKLNVLLVADIDCTTNQFFLIREQGDNEEFGIRFDFDNVTMVLNLIDQAVGDERFCEIRSRRRVHRTLSKIDALTKDAEAAATQEIEDLRNEFRKTSDDLEAEAQKKQAEIEADLRKQYEKDGKITDAQMLGVLQEIARIQERLSRQNQQKIQLLSRGLEDRIKEIDTKLVREEQRIQDRYKLWSVLLPPIPPLVVALVVWAVRRSREREGISASRQRQRRKPANPT